MVDILNRGGCDKHHKGGMDESMIFIILLLLMCSGGFGNSGCGCGGGGGFR